MKDWARAGVGALVQPRAAGDLQQRVGNHVLETLDAAGGELRHQRVGVAVHDEAGQAVGFAVDQAHAVAVDAEQAARMHGALDARAQKGRVDALGFVEAPDPRADARGRAQRRPGEELPVGRFDAHRFARVGAALGDGAFEHPGVAALQRAFLAGFESDGFHAADCRAAFAPVSAGLWPWRAGGRRRRRAPDAGSRAGCRPGCW